MAITVFSFPPDKGNVGTAAYLNVFGSIYKVLQDLKAQGYTVDDVPEQQEDLIKMVSSTMYGAGQKESGVNLYSCITSCICKIVDGDRVCKSVDGDRATGG